MNHKFKVLLTKKNKYMIFAFSIRLGSLNREKKVIFVKKQFKI
jgi:hypothetical protein